MAFIYKIFNLNRRIIVTLSNVATFRRRHVREMEAGCRKQPAAIMRDGRDRVRSIFSISGERTPYYSDWGRDTSKKALLFDSGRRRSFSRIRSHPLSPLISLAYFVAVKIQFIPGRWTGRIRVFRKRRCRARSYGITNRRVSNRVISEFKKFDDRWRQKVSGVYHTTINLYTIYDKS